MLKNYFYIFMYILISFRTFANQLSHQSKDTLEKEIRYMYSGNISKAVCDLIKGLPAKNLNIIYDNHTDSTFINTFQMYLQKEDIAVTVFNITEMQYQEEFFSFLLEVIDQYEYANCIFFCTYRYYEHILIELVENNIIHRNMLFIFYWGTKPFKRYFIRSLHESISTIVITTPRNDTYRFYYNQAVSHRKHHLALINWWSEAAGLFRRPTLPNPNDIYKDFKGKIFYIPVVHKPPWYFVKVTNESVEVTGGRDDKLLAVIAHALNFRYKYVDPVELALGTIASNNSFQSALTLVWKREADFFLGDVTLTADRRTMVEFSFLTLADSGAFLTHSPSRLNEALVLIRPFHWRVWPPLILITIFSGPFLYALIALPDKWRHKPHIKSHSKLFSNCVWFTVCLYLKQMGKDPGKSDKVRLFIITISIAATYVIGNFYSANLTSMLARPGREKPIENLFQLEDAMKDKEYKLFVEEHSSYYDLLQNGTGIYKRLWHLMKHQTEYIIESVENGVKKVRHERNIAVIAGRETLYFDVQRFGASHFHLSEKLNTAYSAIALQLGCPYLENMNRVLMAIFEAGILTKMTEDEYELLGKQTASLDDVGTVIVEPGKTAGQTDPEKSKEKAQKDIQDNEGIRAINIKTLQGAFFVLLLGHALAGLLIKMDPQLVAKRRSTIFQRIQLELTHSSVIRKRIQPGKFPASTVGIIKIIAIILLLSAAITFLTNDTCPKTENWYVWLLPLATCSGAVSTIIFYAIFTLGLAVKYPDFWFITDIAACVITGIFIIISSIATMTECMASDTMYKIPGPLGICGALFLLFSAAGLFIMYRNKETKVQEVRHRPAPTVRSMSTEVEA